MDRFAKLVALVLGALGASSAQAGYAQLAPPAGFGGSPAGWTFAPSANDATFGRVIHQPNGLKVPVPGTSTTMSASYRLAANAPRIAAAVIFANPYLRLAVGIATWLGVGKVVYDVATGTWRETSPLGESDGYQYRTNSWSEALWHPSPSSACGAFAAHYSGEYPGGQQVTYTVTSTSSTSCGFKITSTYPGYPSTTSNTTIPLAQRATTQPSSCPAGWTQSPAGCLSPALTQPQMVELLNPANQPGWPMPETVPRELPPGTPLPVEQPVINPAPGPNPAPRPLFVPTGDPVPNPNYDPNAQPSPANQPWKQPGVRVVPSPTPAEPFRVDIQPIDRPMPGPEPLPGPVSEDEPTPGDKPKPDEQQSLCEKHPEILACQKLDEPQGTDLPESEKNISITPDGGWGADNATCPAPRMITAQGRQIPIPFDLFCTYMQGMRPIIIAMAWLSAAFILLGAREGST